MIDPKDIEGMVIVEARSHVCRGNRYVHTLVLHSADGREGLIVDLASCDTDHIGLFEHTAEHVEYYRKIEK